MKRLGPPAVIDRHDWERCLDLLGRLDFLADWQSTPANRNRQAKIVATIKDLLMGMDTPPALLPDEPFRLRGDRR
jgi:hypothetical protein